MVDQPDAAIPSPDESKSFVVETVLKGLERGLPDKLKGELIPYLRAAPGLDGGEEPERRRGQLCAEWAKALAKEQHDSAVGRVVASVVEDVKGAEEKVDAALVGVESDVVSGGTPKGFHTELNESFEAVKEAEKVAGRHGWEAVPWRALLDDLIAVT